VENRVVTGGDFLSGHPGGDFPQSKSIVIWSLNFDLMGDLPLVKGGDLLGSCSTKHEA